jgi:NTP pyrophosphatase (non-canonical NTP hydrolase)
METSELQNEANKIIESVDKKLNANHNEENTIIHLLEELGEVARQINNKNIRKIAQDRQNIEEELADVQMFIMRLATINNINIENAIINKIKKLKERYNLN